MSFIVLGIESLTHGRQELYYRTISWAFNSSFCRSPLTINWKKILNPQLSACICMCLYTDTLFQRVFAGLLGGKRGQSKSKINDYSLGFTFWPGCQWFKVLWNYSPRFHALYSTWPEWELLSCDDIQLLINTILAWIIRRALYWSADIQHITQLYLWIWDQLLWTDMLCPNFLFTFYLFLNSFT